jgi:carbon storage regulator CsrA
MLVLSRKPNETVILDTHPTPTKVTVVEIRGDNVRLGFDAPPEIAITRPDAKTREPPPHRAGDGEGAFQ